VPNVVEIRDQSLISTTLGTYLSRITIVSLMMAL
jgi:hypothetical protein